MAGNCPFYVMGNCGERGLPCVFPLPNYYMCFDFSMKVSPSGSGEDLLRAMGLLNKVVEETSGHKPAPPEKRTPAPLPAAHPAPLVEAVLISATTKDCPTCGKKLKAVAEACPACGAKFEVYTRAYCTHCRKVIHANAQGKCPDCHAEELLDPRLYSKMTAAGTPAAPKKSAKPAEAKATTPKKQAAEKPGVKAARAKSTATNKQVEEKLEVKTAKVKTITPIKQVEENPKGKPKTTGKSTASGKARKPQIDRRAEAIKMIQKALSYWVSGNPDVRATGLSRVAVVLAEAGVTTQAIELLEKAQNLMQQVRDANIIRGSIATAFVSASSALNDDRLFEQGTGITNQIDNPGTRCLAWVKIYDYLFKHGDVPRSTNIKTRLLSQMETLSGFEYSLVGWKTAKVLSESGATSEEVTKILEDALKHARADASSGNTFLRDLNPTAVREVALRYVTIGGYLTRRDMLERGLEIARGLADPSARASVYSEAAVAYAMLGLEDETHKCLSQHEAELKSLTDRHALEDAEKVGLAARTFSGILLGDDQLIEAGLKAIDAFGEKDWALINVIAGLVNLSKHIQKADFIIQANKVAEHIEKPADRDPNLVERVDILWQTGHAKEAQALIEQALANAETKGTPDLIGSAYLNIGEAILHTTRAPSAAVSTQVNLKPETIYGDIKKCPNCGREIKVNATTCNTCKAKFKLDYKGYCSTERAVVEADKNGLCAKCGKEVVDLHVKSTLLEAPLPPPQSAGKKAAETKPEAPPASVPAEKAKPPAETRKCHLCAETIKAEAKICRFCGAMFDVAVVGYCANCHKVMNVSADVKCSICNGPIIDRHIDSKFTGKRATQPPQVQPTPLPTPVQSSANVPRSAPASVHQPPPQPISPSKKIVKVKIEVTTGLCGNTRYNGVYDFTLPLDQEASQLLNHIAADIGVTIGWSPHWALRCKNGYLYARPGGGKLQTLRQAEVQDGDILRFKEE